MTEKDTQIPETSKLQTAPSENAEKVAQADLPDAEKQLQQEEVSNDVIGTFSKASLEKSDDVEEPSEFLQKWRKSHEAYLTSQKRTNASSENAPQEENATTSKKSGFFKKNAVAKNPSQEQQKEELKILAIKKKASNPIPKTVLWKALPILLFASSFVIISLYFITPASKMKQIIVTGNKHVASSKIVQGSLIRKDDYILSTLVNKTGHERNIRYASSWIKDAKITYAFPNVFTISITEYNQMGFIKVGEQYYSVLSNGEVSETETPKEQLPATFTTIHLMDRELIKKLIAQLTKINQTILSEIQDIELTPSKATNDLLTMTMVNGHKILIPLTDIDYKLPYYEKIAPQLQVASVIDMEVGIFTYARP